MTSLETLEGLWQTRPGGLAFAAYAESLEIAGRRAEAEVALAEGVKRWPRHLAGRILQGRLARDKGDLETARVAFQVAVQIDNNSRAALHGLADICTRQQYLKLAFETWNRLSILEPENALAAESARKIASQMDSNGGGTGLVPVRDNEDFFSREALTEGASAPATASSHGGIPPSEDFDLNLGEIPIASPFGAAELPIAGRNEDLLGFQMPDLSFTPSPMQATTAYTPPDTTSTPLAKFEESGFATLEMPSFPAKTIPPPPLELPKVAPETSAAQTESLLRPTLPGPFAISDDRSQQAEATQWMAAPHKASAPVTGDDIEDRLDEVFGVTSQPLPPSMLPLSTEPGLSGMIAPAGSESPTATVTGDDVEDRLDEVFGASSVHTPTTPPPVSAENPESELDHPTVEIATDPRVTGDDVEDRLDEVFGSSSVHTPILPPPVSREASTDKVTGDDIDDRLGELFGETGEMALVAPETKPAPAAAKAESTVVSGRDIEGRLDELFGESVIDLTSPIDSVAGVVDDHHDRAADKAADTSVFARENPATPARVLEGQGDTSVLPRETVERVPDDEVLVRKPGLESTTEFRSGSLHLDPHRLVDEAAKGSEIDPGGSTIDLPTIGYGATSQPETSIRLTGDDVDSRLDELFASSEFLSDPQVTPISAKTGFVARPAHTDPGEVTGEDIEGRLDDLFGSDSDFPVSLPTVTFAEEYLRQGHKDKAISIYRQLLDRDPSNKELRRRLDEIEGRS